MHLSPESLTESSVGTGASTDAEWSLLRAACSASAKTRDDDIRKLLQAPIRWNDVLNLADRHGVEPLLCETLARTQELVPQEILRSLAQTQQANLHKSLFLSRELIRVVDRLSDAGVHVLPYKGLALAEMIYGDIAMRRTGDIDLLIHARDFPAIREAVRDLGYTPHATFSEVHMKEYMETGYECAFDGPAGRNLLEVQWALQPRFYAVDFDVDGLFERAQKVEVAGHPMMTLSAEDMFVVLSLHAAKHVWGRMSWLCDLERVINLPNLNWTWIGAQARELGIERILRISVLLVNRLFDSAIPAAAEHVLIEDRQARKIADEILASMTKETAYDVESISYFRLMMRLRERRRDRLRFLSRLISTPGPGEWQSVLLPRPLFFGYRLIRLFRLAARVAR